MFWVVEGDERSNFGGGENVFVVPLKLIGRTDVIPGDFNEDGTLDLADFSILTGNFNTTNRTFADGDMNFNGRVDLADFLAFRAAFKAASNPAGAPVPEPSSGLLLAVGIFALCRRGRLIGRVAGHS
jgi:hypothetical protein